MKIYRSLLFLFFIASCNAPQAVYDYDERVDFSTFKSYAMHPEMNTGLSQLDQPRLLESVHKVLKQKNLVVSQDPDLILKIYSEEYKRDSNTRLGIGVGGTGRNVGVGVSGGIPIGGADTYLQLTFDLVDAETNTLVWQAVVKSVFDLDASPDERQQKFEEISKKAFKAYPPKN